MVNMIDPLTAFGLATNIIQFLDLGGRVVQTGYRTYKSANRASEENITLEAVTSDLLDVSGRLTLPLADDEVSLSPPDASLEQLGRQCQDLAKRLLELLGELKIKSEGILKGWQALQVAVREQVTKKSEIKSISGLLNTYRHQITTHLLAIMRNDQSTILKELRSFQNSTALQANDLSELRNMKRELIDTLSSHQALLGPCRAWETARTFDVNMESRLLKRILDQMKIMATKSSVLATESQILASLDFQQIHMRQDLITEPYSDTFTWIFDRDATNFKSWLEHESGIFWISGKAGSGKSTLMKFLTSHARTSEILREWAGSKRLVMASHYFWSAGTPMQKSQRGLLQSLLFQLLSQFPDLISMATPLRWNAPANFHRHPPPWSREELSAALSAVLSSRQLPARFCFFIDGLDEYCGDYHDFASESQGTSAEVDHYELIRVIETLADNPDVKVCLSSRPWNPFRKAFGDHTRKTIVLEELTPTDIVQYISGILEEDPRYKELARKDDRASELTEQIRERAQGVFLWVYFATRSVLRGLSEDDDIEELRRRIQRLPMRLKEFFRRILISIDPDYQELTCRLLSLASYESPLPLSTCWHLKLELDDPHYALEKNERSVLSSTTLKSSATTYIDKWCRDLLQIQIAESTDSQGNKFIDRDTRVFNISFPHRTVRDFLADSDVRQYIEDRVGNDFDERLSMCRLYLTLAKTLTAKSLSSTDKTKRNRFEKYAKSIMHHAKAYETRNGAALSAILNEFDRVGQQLIDPQWVDHVILDRRNVYMRSTLDEQCQSNFLAFAVSYDLLQFVSEALNDRPDGIHKPGRPLLDYAIHPSHLHTIHRILPSLRLQLTLSPLRLPILIRNPPPPLPHARILNKLHRRKVMLILLHGAHPRHVIKRHDLQPEIRVIRDLVRLTNKRLPNPASAQH